MTKSVKKAPVAFKIEFEDDIVSMYATAPPWTCDGNFLDQAGVKMVS